MVDIIHIVGSDEQYGLKLASDLKRQHEEQGQVVYIVYNRANYARWFLSLSSASLIIVVGMEDFMPFIISDTGGKLTKTIRTGE